MSFLAEIKENKLKLKATETQVTYADGSKILECKDTIKLLDEKSHGFVVDTKPDAIPACIIDDKLFLGSQDAVDMENIKQLGITHILSVGIETPNVGLSCDVVCKFIACLDLPKTNIKSICEIGTEFISNALSIKGKVLVHCNAGVSRSASVVIYYLMSVMQLSFDQAYGLVKSRRPCIQPNSGFLKQLKEFKNKKDSYSRS